MPTGIRIEGSADHVDWTRAFDGVADAGMWSTEVDLAGVRYLRVIFKNSAGVEQWLRELFVFPPR